MPLWSPVQPSWRLHNQRRRRSQVLCAPSWQAQQPAPLKFVNIHHSDQRIEKDSVLTLYSSNYISRRVYAPYNPPYLHRADRNIVAKTRSQLNRRLPDGKKLPWPPFGKQWYAGCTTLIIGNSLKAGIRTFPHIHTYTHKPRGSRRADTKVMQASLHSTCTRTSSPTLKAKSLVPQPSLRVSVPEPQNRYWQSHPLKV